MLTRTCHKYFISFFLILPMYVIQIMSLISFFHTHTLPLMVFLASAFVSCFVQQTTVFPGKACTDIDWTSR